MDATKHPLKIPAEYAIYADKHEIFELMMQLLQSLVVNRPNDPLTYLVNLLKCKKFEVFTVMILGPPCSGKHSLAELLCCVCPDLKLIDPIPIIRNYLADEARKIPKEIRPPQPKRYRVPPDLAAKIIAEHLQRDECTQRSWVMPGFPRNKSQAIALGDRGVFPQNVVMLEVSDLKVYSRFAKKYPEFREFFLSETWRSQRSSAAQSSTPPTSSQQPIVSDIPGKSTVSPDKSTPSSADVQKHSATTLTNSASWPPSPSTGVPTGKGTGTTTTTTTTTTSIISTLPPPTPIPPAVQKFQRILYNFRRNAPGMFEFYGKRCRRINGESRLEDILSLVVDDLETRPLSLAPFNPRILLLGPPASCKRTIASSLATKYDIVNLHCGELLRQNQARGALDGKAKRDLTNITDEEVVKVLRKRIERVDCVTCGWILRGFPRTERQAKLFRDENFHPNKVIFLDIIDTICLERILPRRIDPVTGYVYNSLNKKPSEPAIEARLVIHPRDKEEHVRLRLIRYRDNEQALNVFYPYAQHVDATKPIFTMVEVIETILLRPKRRNLTVPVDLFPHPPTTPSISGSSMMPSFINFHVHPLDVDFVDFSSVD